MPNAAVFIAQFAYGATEFTLHFLCCCTNRLADCSGVAGNRDWISAFKTRFNQAAFIAAVAFLLAIFIAQVYFDAGKVV